MQQLNVTMSTLLSSHKTDALHAHDITLWAVIGGQCNIVSGLTRAHILAPRLQVESVSVHLGAHAGHTG